MEKKRAETQLHPTTFAHLMAWGESHGLPPRISTILCFLINKTLKPHRMPEVQTALQIKGGDTEALRDEALHEYLSKRGLLKS